MSVGFGARFGAQPTFLVIFRFLHDFFCGDLSPDALFILQGVNLVAVINGAVINNTSWRVCFIIAAVLVSSANTHTVKS
jgi:hypothetical protein